MTLEDLREEISIELESMEKVVNEAILLLNDLSGSKPTIREKTAAAAFLAQFYGGIENILKRIHRYHGISIPTGDSWHTDIFKRFCNPLLMQALLSGQQPKSGISAMSCRALLLVSAAVLGKIASFPPEL